MLLQLVQIHNTVYLTSSKMVTPDLTANNFENSFISLITFFTDSEFFSNLAAHPKINPETYAPFIGDIILCSLFDNFLLLIDLSNKVRFNDACI